MENSAESIFDRIALAISGGGFRAAAYGLGTLNTLHLLGILENVHILSTISGGTITGAFYALRRKKGQSFDAIYTDLYELLSKDELLEKAIHKWGKAASEEGQNYKLIRAFADVYHEDLYANELFNVFWQPDADGKPFHLQSIIFSATELYTGTAFRFQYAGHLPDVINGNGRTFDSYYIGNGNVTIPRNRAREVRLADIVASSSCFPVGFEPLVLPNDFFPSTDNHLVFQSTNGGPVHIDRLGLIDGGVYDNQGIEAIVTANRRNAVYLDSIESSHSLTPTLEENNATLSGVATSTAIAKPNASLNPSTLLLIADVASAEKGIYEPPEAGPKRGRSSPLGSIGKKVRKTLVLLLIVAGVFILAQLGSRHGGNFFFGLVAGLALGAAGLLFAAQRLWNQLTSQLEALQPRIYRMAMPVFMQFTFRQWGYLLNVRLMTLVKLLLSVFLRRARTLNYGLVFQNDNAFSPKAVISSIIGGIVHDAEQSNTSERPSIRSESRLFLSIIKAGSDMGTTLWWLDDKSRMDAIIASAEITLIYRILLNVEKQLNKRPDTIPKLDQQVIDRANLIWKAFVLSQDKNKPATYFPQFRLHPSMFKFIATPETTMPDSLITIAKMNVPQTTDLVNPI